MKPGRYVRISIADRGVGIPAENLARLFEPYFTTTPGGAGLGLATSQRIVNKHGGYISVHSHVGPGTTIHVCLPAASEHVESARNELTPVAARPFTSRS